jgi:hypothetical protein
MIHDLPRPYPNTWLINAMTNLLAPPCLLPKIVAMAFTFHSRVHLMETGIITFLFPDSFLAKLIQAVVFWVFFLFRPVFLYLGHIRLGMILSTSLDIQVLGIA